MRVETTPPPPLRLISSRVAPPRQAGTELIILGVALVCILSDVAAARYIRGLQEQATETLVEQAARAERVKARHAFISMARARPPGSSLTAALFLLSARRCASLRACWRFGFPRSHHLAGVHRSLQVSHELRTPASAISGALEILRNTGLDEMQTSFLVRRTCEQSLRHTQERCELPE